MKRDGAVRIYGKTLLPAREEGFITYYRHL
jgi:hypothetical protein